MSDPKVGSSEEARTPEAPAKPQPLPDFSAKSSTSAATALERWSEPSA